MAIDPIHAYSPIPPQPAEKASDIQPKSSEKKPEPAVFQTIGAASREETKGFGPDYILDDSLKSKEIVGGVPFAPIAPAQTLSALPPIHPLGTAAFTELILQESMQPRRKA